MNKNMKFEEAVARLEEIVRELEDGSITLDASLKLYEEGVALVRLCNGRLDGAERKIKQLVKTDDGIAEEPFENDAEQ